MTAKKAGRFGILEQLLADGFRFMFGNPGTSEEGFLDALSQYPDLRYILTLQESVAVLVADGYARASGRPALVQIHSTPGLGNAIGAIYQAWRGHSPLVVIGGDAGIKYQSMDAQMAGDLVAFARPVTKWSAMVQHPASLLRMVRRAVKIAATPPTGPVYLCLPMDVLDAPLEGEVRPASIPSTRVAPEADFISQAATLLAGAATPMVFVGDGIGFSEAQPELARVAERLGAEVWGLDVGDLLMSYRNPLYQGMAGHMFGSSSFPIFQKGDVNLVCGTYVTPEVFPELDSVFAPGARVIHIDLDAYEIAKNHPVDLGVVADPKLSLGLLADALQSGQSLPQKEAASQRAKAIAEVARQKREQALEQDRALREQVPMGFSRFAEELARVLPEDAVLFDEALTNSPPLTRHLLPHRARHYFMTRGGSLGVGFPGAIGAKLAHPDKTVIGFSGEGGSMYTIQTLWTAARHRIDSKFVLCNNRSYRLLQLNILAYWKEQGIEPRDFPLSFDLSQPDIDFVGLAESLGVSGRRVEQPADVRSAIDQMLSHSGPFLVDVRLEADVHPEMIGVVCGQ